jgi:hypothetical protein
VDEFLASHPRSQWATGTPTLTMPELKDYIQRYQDPHQADSIMKIQRELDETKIVLHKTIESVLERGEKIDDLVAKSDGLSKQSKMFYRKWLSFSLVMLYVVGRVANMRFPHRASEEAELLLRRHVGLGCYVALMVGFWRFLFLSPVYDSPRLIPLLAEYTTCSVDATSWRCERDNDASVHAVVLRVTGRMTLQANANGPA